MLSAHQLSKSFENNKILDEVSFNLNPGERVGVIGPNGCGKTTLFRILIGEEFADSGHVSFTPTDLRVGYLTQGFEPPPDITIKTLIQQTTGDPAILEAEIIRLSTALSQTPDDSELQRAYDQILMKMQQPSTTGKLASILAALGLDQLPDEQIAATLSGGQKTRLSLALVLLSDPQLLLLDEPTNHLDIEMLEWLENWLRDFQGAALIISHDRTFLDRAVTRILDLNPRTHKVRSFDGSYDDYIATLSREHEKQLQAYNDQTAEIRRMRRDIARTRAQAERTEREASSIRIGGPDMKIKGFKDYQQGIAKKVAQKAKSREKKLERFIDSDDRVEKPKSGWQIRLKFDRPVHLGKQVLNLENLTIGYPNYPPLLQEINLQVQSGQRIAFTGSNGSGKTTLLRTIAGRLSPVDGRVSLGSTVKLGYMSQEQETLDPKKNAIDTIQAAAPLNQTEIRNFLHYYLFSGDDPLRPIEHLSYGERARLMLAKLVAEGCNFLLLDEPINHLDIPSREMFEQALTHFEGTVLAVVHDRYFIQRFAKELWIVQDSTIRREVLKIPEELAEI